MRIGTCQETHIDTGFQAFRELTGLVYRLRRSYGDITILATSSVHPRNPIPVEHVRLLDLLTRSENHSQYRVPTVQAIFSKWFLCFLVALRDTFVILQIKVRYYRQLARRKPEPASVVLKTWCFGPESVNGSMDFYYGTLPAQLARRNVANLLLCGNVLARREGAFAKAVFRLGEVHAVPESALIPLWAPVASAFRQLRSGLRLRRAAANEEDKRFALVCAQVAMDCVHSATMRNIMQFHIAETVARYWKPDVYVTLYEGQPWEKLAWQGMKTARPECLIVGYQHTVVMRHALSLTSPNTGSWEVSTPDVVLCLGEVTERMMMHGHEHAGTCFAVFGSHRRTADGGAYHRPNPSRRKVLVVPEGNLPESRLLFNFALSVARLAPDYDFIFRCHPLLPFAQVREHLECDPELIPNVILSSAPSISTDFERCSIILYRGSSAVFYAVLDGLLPVYFRSADLFDIDPLFELKTWREVVCSEDETLQLLQSYSGIGDEEAFELWKPAWEYVNSYTVPVDEGSIDRFLTATGLNVIAS